MIWYFSLISHWLNAVYVADKHFMLFFALAMITIKSMSSIMFWKLLYGIHSNAFDKQTNKQTNKAHQKFDNPVQKSLLPRFRCLMHANRVLCNQLEFIHIMIVFRLDDPYSRAWYQDIFLWVWLRLHLIDWFRFVLFRLQHNIYSIQYWVEYIYVCVCLCRTGIGWNPLFYLSQWTNSYFHAT